MNAFKAKQIKKKRKSLFRRWHRRVGLSASIFLANLAVTGILLNHSNDLDLHKKYISSSWLLDAYGVKAPPEFICTTLSKNENSICSVGNKLYHNDSFLLDDNSYLVGLIILDQIIYVATGNKIYLFTLNFDLIETLDNNSGLPTPLNKIGISNKRNKIVIENKDKNIFEYDPDKNTWQPSSALQIISKTYRLNSGKRLINLQKNYLEKQITYLKFIQDLHSARLFKMFGKYLTDLFGLIIILLSISGYIAWQRRTKRENEGHGGR